MLSAGNIKKKIEKITGLTLIQISKIMHSTLLREVETKAKAGRQRKTPKLSKSRYACVPADRSCGVRGECNCVSSVGDLDPDPHVFRLRDPDPLVRGADPDPAPDPSLFS